LLASCRLIVFVALNEANRYPVVGQLIVQLEWKAERAENDIRDHQADDESVD